MPIFIVIAGLMILVAGVRGKADKLAGQVKNDSEAFLSWFAIVIILGLIGISPTFRPISKAFLVLIILVFLLKNGKNIIAGFRSVNKLTSNFIAPINSFGSSSISA